MSSPVGYIVWYAEATVFIRFRQNFLWGRAERISGDSLAVDPLYPVQQFIAPTLCRVMSFLPSPLLSLSQKTLNLGVFFFASMPRLSMYLCRAPVGFQFPQRTFLLSNQYFFLPRRVTNGHRWALLFSGTLHIITRQPRRRWLSAAWGFRPIWAENQGMAWKPRG